METILKNWKTSLLGLAALAMTALVVMGKISADAYMVTLGIIAGGGFLFAPDAKQDAGAKAPVSVEDERHD